MSEIRKYFTSRFGEDGVLMEFDFGQLEVVALAYLTQDKQLIEDIVNGVDMHVINAANMYGVATHEVKPWQRKIAKGCTFQLQYGAGPYSMAKTWDISVDMAKHFIEQYYTRYPKVRNWQEGNIRRVKESRIVDGSITPKGYPRGKGMLRLPTGRTLHFYERDVDKKPWTSGTGAPTDFWPTEIKNYPVQSFATGDIVPMILGKLFRALKSENAEFNEKVKMINTVHDSVLFDVHADYISLVHQLVMEIMLGVPEYLEKDFGIEFNVPITADCKIGDNWLEMVDY